MAPAVTRPRTNQPSLWRRPLLVGVCFGLGYGLAQRLLDLRLPGFVQWGQSFDVRQMPGQGLEQWRLRVGADVQDLRGRLDLQQLDAAATTPKDGAEALGEAGADAIDPSAASAAAEPGREAPSAPDLPPPAASARQAGQQAAPIAPPAPSQP